jgi:hypothetical protein
METPNITAVMVKATLFYIHLSFIITEAHGNLIWCLIFHSVFSKLENISVSRITDIVILTEKNYLLLIYYCTRPYVIIIIMSVIEPGISVSIVSAYRLDDRATDVRSPAETKQFSSNLCIQTGSGPHPASCTMGTGGPFPGGRGVMLTTHPHLMPRS